MHPEVISFFSSLGNQDVEYYHKEIKGVYIAAYALFYNGRVGVEQWKKFPISYDEIMIPVAKEAKMMFPEKTNGMSYFNRWNFKNVNFNVLRKKNNCFAKRKYSAKTEKKRRNEYNRFLRAGGRCCQINQFKPEELADFYIFLFKSRFNENIECYSKENLISIITAMYKMLFGHILFIENEPCAIDLIFMGESEKIIYFDLPNGGVNMKYSDLSPGSVLMWKNICSAREYCEKSGKDMRFSMGSIGKDWNYKLRWADAHATGKVIF